LVQNVDMLYCLTDDSRILLRFKVLGLRIVYII